MWWFVVVVVAVMLVVVVLVLRWAVAVVVMVCFAGVVVMMMTVVTVIRCPIQYIYIVKTFILIHTISTFVTMKNGSLFSMMIMMTVLLVMLEVLALVSAVIIFLWRVLVVINGVVGINGSDFITDGPGSWLCVNESADDS